MKTFNEKLEKVIAKINPEFLQSEEYKIKGITLTIHYENKNNLDGGHALTVEELGYNSQDSI